jgi:hypothetical protein
VLTVTVRVPLPPLTVTELRLHAGGKAVTGVTAQLSLTVELKPPEGVIVIVDVAEPPGVTVAGVSGAADRVNDGAVAVTVRLAVVVWTRVPEVPLIVKLMGPPTLDVVVVTLSGTLTCSPPEGTVTEAGEQLAPEGSPEQVTITVPANPACGFT